MRPAAVFILMCAAAGASAEDRAPEEVPPPPAIAESDEPAVRIPAQDREKVEEVRIGGRVVMLKITPPGGKPYYLLDNGLPPGPLDDGVHFPMWPVFLFD